MKITPRTAAEFEAQLVTPKPKDEGLPSEAQALEHTVIALREGTAAAAAIPIVKQTMQQRTALVMQRAFKAYEEGTLTEAMSYRVIAQLAELHALEETLLKQVRKGNAAGERFGKMKGFDSAG